MKNKFIVLGILLHLIAPAALGAETLPRVSPFQIPEVANGLLHKSVLNGTVVTSSEQLSKFTVAIDVNNPAKGAFRCTGVIVAKDLILTAGHCFSEGATAKVKFGTGGDVGFSATLDALDYRVIYVDTYGTPRNPWVNGQLTYDALAQNRFWHREFERTSWHKLAEENGFKGSRFDDLALIKIAGVPDGFEKIEFYSGTPEYRQRAVSLGFGFNSRSATELREILLKSEVLLVGHFSEADSDTRGWKFYEPTGKNICFGDSGGPLVIQTGKKFKLLGINTYVTNTCANDGFAAVPGYYKEFLLKAAEELRSKIEI